MSHSSASTDSRRRRSLVLGGLTALAVVMGLVAAPSGAAAARHAAGKRNPVVMHNPNGHFLGVVRTLPHGSHAASPGGGTPPLLYHNGPVLHGVKNYAIYWQPAGFYIPAGYKATVNQFFTDVSIASFTRSNVFAVSTQYFDHTGPGGTNRFVLDNLPFGGGIVDTNPFPTSGCANYTIGDGSVSRACLTDSQFQAEIAKVITARSLPTGAGVEYFIYTPYGVASCFTAAGASCYDPLATGGSCAYHSSLANNTTYSNMPFAAITGCSPGQFPNGDNADPVLNVTSHESNETLTDPYGTAWFDSTGFENGDECNFTFGTALGNNGLGSFNQVIAGNDYWLQQEWSNRTNSCVSSNTFPAQVASFTVSPASPVHGTSATFTSTVTDTDDTTFTYQWSFGDGTSSTAKNPAHTYATAGTKTVTLIVVDPHGDQVRTIRSITVS